LKLIEAVSLTLRTLSPGPYSIAGKHSGNGRALGR